MSLSGISNVSNCGTAGQGNRSEDEPVVKFPPFYRPYPELRSEFRSLLKSIRCGATEKVIQDIKELAKDHGLHVASWLLGRKGKRIEGVILIENKQRNTEPPMLDSRSPHIDYTEGDLSIEDMSTSEEDFRHLENVYFMKSNWIHMDMVGGSDDIQQIELKLVMSIDSRMIEGLDFENNKEYDLENNYETNWWPIFLVYINDLYKR